LIDGSTEKNLVRLVFYDASTEKLRDIQDETYKPYFFVAYPLNAEDEKALRGLDAKTSPAEKRDLFTGEAKKLTRVELDDPSLLSAASRMLKQRWEPQVSYVLSYVYDHDLIFGAPYRLEGRKIKPVYGVNETLRLRFQEKFSGMNEMDPLKYEMLERWFTLCSQPIPQVPLGKLGISEGVDYEKLYLAFLLSRIANLPLPVALTNRQVSTWVRSILHFYLRRKNILIPRSAELRRGEPVRRVPGALTFQPKTGTYFDTVVVDFESLYPSVIDSYNLSYETVDCGHEECAVKKVPETNHYVCVEKRGIYSVLIGALKDLRIHWFNPLSRDTSVSDEERQLAEAASSLLKLILVSSYGVTVRIHGLAQPALAESITAYGRYALRESWNLAEKDGLRPLYGDTDSLFLDNPTDEQVDRLIRTVKEKLRLDLAVDKVYSVCVLPRAMKAYLGIGKDGTPDVKGLTAIKSNSPPFIRKIFMDCARELVNVKNWTEFEDAKENMRRVVEKAISDFKSGKVPMKELEYTVRLHFDSSERPTDEEALHQPYQCAVQLVDLGREIRRGDKVSFVKVKPFNYGGKTFTVKPAELVRDFHEINVDDYVRNLRTALSQTFKPMNLSFKEEPKTTLADFI
jgi:DNA polymerase elongation subunit (family B)